MVNTMTTKQSDFLGVLVAERDTTNVDGFLAELRQHLERAGLARAIEPLVGGQPGAELGLLAQRVKRVDLAIHDATDQEMEAVGSEVDCSEGFVSCHSPGTVTPAHPARKLSLSSECNFGTRSS